MEKMKDNFQLVILNCPYEKWDSTVVRTLFTKMVSLKKEGYGNRYVSDVLPVDTSDFIASHVLLCEKQRYGALEPIMGYKSISLEKCRQYNLNFPGLSLVQSAKMPLHTQAVEKIIDQCEVNNKGLAYLGSWTVSQEFKNRRTANRNLNLKDAFSTFYRLLYKEQNISEVIIGGTLRFRTEKLFHNLGHRPLSLDGIELPSIQVVHLAKEPVLVMHAEGFVEAFGEVEKKWLSVWNNRVYFDHLEDVLNLKSAA